jgi:hypothetical protein
MLCTHVYSNIILISCLLSKGSFLEEFIPDEDWGCKWDVGCDDQRNFDFDYNSKTTANLNFQTPWVRDQFILE